MNVQHAHIAAAMQHVPSIQSLALSVQALLALDAILEDLIIAETAHGITPEIIEELDSVKRARAVFASAAQAYPRSTH